MERFAIAVLLGCVVVAGCLGTLGAGVPPESPDGAGPGETPATPTNETGTVPAENVSAEYVVRAGSIPDHAAHVYVDVSAYLAERPDDVYPCTDDAPLLDNEYDPTPTPLPTAAGQCERSDFPRVDVASLDGTETLGRVDANATFSGGHSLVVHDVTVVLENGTTASDVYDTDFRAVTERSPPSGSYGVEIGVTDYEGSDRALRWRYGVGAERFDPAVS